MGQYAFRLFTICQRCDHIFDKSLAYREADWMRSPRGPDVSPMLGWYPIVSMLQILIDMPLADTVPMGYGHVYAPDHYLNAWLEVTGVEGWSAEQIEALKSISIIELSVKMGMSIVVAKYVTPQIYVSKAKIRRRSSTVYHFGIH